MPSKNAIQIAQQRWEQTKFDLPVIIGEEYVNFSKQAFIRQGFIDGHYEKWKERKDKSKRNKGRAILVKSGRLKRSIRLLRTGYLYAVVGSDVPYAQIQNDGGVIDKTVSVRAHKRKGTHYTNTYSTASKRKSKRKGKYSAVEEVKAHERHMHTEIDPRPFLGESAFFNKRAVAIITRELKKCFQP